MSNSTQRFTLDALVLKSPKEIEIQGCIEEDGKTPIREGITLSCQDEKTLLKMLTRATTDLLNEIEEAHQ